MLHFDRDRLTVLQLFTPIGLPRMRLHDTRALPPPPPPPLERPPALPPLPHLALPPPQTPHAREALSIRLPPPPTPPSTHPAPPPTPASVNIACKPLIGYPPSIPPLQPSSPSQHCIKALSVPPYGCILQLRTKRNSEDRRLFETPRCDEQIKCMTSRCLASVF